MNRVIELRQYTLKPGRRDDLIALFERQFVESQEAEGMRVIGIFRDANDPDRFVWLRGFADMESRARSLAAFYSGPVWKAHRNAANDTMIDSDNVLLLKPAWDGADFPKPGPRAPLGASRSAKGIVLASIHYFDAPVPDAFLVAFRALPDPHRIAAYVTEGSENTFPALPVRAGENVFVTFSLFADNNNRSSALPHELAKQVKATETLRLIPTARSSLHA
ncbi:MAG TPA: NIPSNAP family protein [Rhizomicrobium sp.]|jgi:quinol monooxygenase YgiN